MTIFLLVLVLTLLLVGAFTAKLLWLAAFIVLVLWLVARGRAVSKAAAQRTRR